MFFFRRLVGFVSQHTFSPKNLAEYTIARLVLIKTTGNGQTKLQNCVKSEPRASGPHL